MQCFFDWLDLKKTFKKTWCAIIYTSKHHAMQCIADRGWYVYRLKCILSRLTFHVQKITKYPTGVNYVFTVPLCNILLYVYYFTVAAVDVNQLEVCTVTQL